MKTILPLSRSCALAALLLAGTTAGALAQSPEWEESTGIKVNVVESPVERALIGVDKQRRAYQDRASKTNAYPAD